jgi:hypothetical protein
MSESKDGKKPKAATQSVKPDSNNDFGMAEVTGVSNLSCLSKTDKSNKSDKSSKTDDLETTLATKPKNVITDHDLLVSSTLDTAQTEKEKEPSNEDAEEAESVSPLPEP